MVRKWTEVHLFTIGKVLWPCSDSQQDLLSHPSNLSQVTHPQQRQTLCSNPNPRPYPLPNPYLKKIDRKSCSKCVFYGDTRSTSHIYSLFHTHTHHNNTTLTLVVLRIYSCMCTPEQLQFMSMSIDFRQWLESRHRHSEITLREPAVHMFVWGPFTHAH